MPATAPGWTTPQRQGHDMNKNPSSATVKTPSSNFTGDVWMNPVFGGDGTSQLTCGLVRFSPGARTNWHSHVNGQLLVCADGTGWSALATGRPSCCAPV